MNKLWSVAPAVCIVAVFLAVLFFIPLGQFGH